MAFCQSHASKNRVPCPREHAADKSHATLLEGRHGGFVRQPRHADRRHGTCKRSPCVNTSLSCRPISEPNFELRLRYLTFARAHVAGTFSAGTGACVRPILPKTLRTTWTHHVHSSFPDTSSASRHTAALISITTKTTLCPKQYRPTLHRQCKLELTLHQGH